MGGAERPLAVSVVRRGLRRDEEDELASVAGLLLGLGDTEPRDRERHSQDPDQHELEFAIWTHVLLRLTLASVSGFGASLYCTTRSPDPPAAGATAGS